MRKYLSSKLRYKITTLLSLISTGIGLIRLRPLSLVVGCPSSFTIVIFWMKYFDWSSDRRTRTRPNILLMTEAQYFLHWHLHLYSWDPDFLPGLFPQKVDQLFRQKAVITVMNPTSIYTKNIFPQILRSGINVVIMQCAPHFHYIDKNFFINPASS